MKFSLKRTLSFLLAFVMVVSLFPAMSTNVFAATVTGLTDTNIGVDATLPSDTSKGSATANGTTITIKATGWRAALVFTGSNTVTVKLKNNSGSSMILSFGYTISNGGSIDISGGSNAVDANNSYSAVLSNEEEVIVAVTSPDGTKTNTVTLTDIKLEASQAGVETIFDAPAYGSYTVNDGSSTTTITAGSASQIFNNAATTRYTLTVTVGSGNKFVGWYNVTTGQYFDTATTTSLYASAATIKPIVVPNTTAVFKVGDMYYTDLDDAINNRGSNKQITLVQSGTISDASYTIPSGVTLLIPRDNNYTPSGKDPESTTDVTAPSAFLTLTLANNTKITVDGTGIIEVEAMHTTLQGSNGARPYGGRVAGGYGAIYMSPGSNITLNGSSTLYAWGYVYGNGSVTANSGSKVYESFQMTDFTGGSNLSAFVDTAPDKDADAGAPGGGDGIKNNDYIKSFPFSQYYIQNIEVPLTLHYGATEYVYATISVSALGQTLKIGTPVEFIGSSGLFTLASGSTITKTYNPSTDRLIFDCNGDSVLKNLVVDMSDHYLAWALELVIQTDKIDSANFILSLNSNMTLNINSGTTTIKQNVSLLPGVEVNIAEGAKLVLDSATNNSNLNANGTGGYNAYIYDNDEWGNFAFTIPAAAPLGALSYSPTTGRYTRKASDLKDVVIDINGELICNGFLYTTKSGASIISSGGTGVIKLVNGAGDSTQAYRLDGSSSKDATSEITSAKLQNGDGSYLATAGAAAGTTFNYCSNCSEWYTGSHFAITWMNGSEVIYSEDVACGDVPAYKATTPTKASDSTIHYIFAGWATTENGTVLSTLPAVTGDATYYAVFTSAAHNDDKIEGGKHYCTVCNYLIGSCSDEGKDHYCDVGGEQMDCCGEYLTSVSRKESTCDEPGYEAYYRCSCGKLYSDAEAQNAISEPVAIPAKNHAWGDPTYTNNGNGTHTANYVCDNDASHTKSDSATEHQYVDGTCVCGDIKNVVVKPEFGNANVTYSISGQVVTVTHSIACKVGYWSESEGKYIAITAEDNGDGSYSFTAPKEVTEVIIVVKGDATGDGELKAGDAARINAAVLGKTTLSAESIFAAEATDDGELKAGDAARVNATVLGKTSLLWMPVA